MSVPLLRPALQLGPYTLSNPYILAPMAGVSELPFRVLARRLGAAAAPTELISAKGLIYGQARTAAYMQHDAAIEAPFWVQLFGGEVESMVAGACRAVELGAHIIEINMGCPVRKVTRNGAGSALLNEPARAAALVAALAQATGVPITVKIRAGWDAHSLNFVELATRLADAGAAAITMHARTRAQGYSGQANWEWLAELAQSCPVPVIGNGDAFTAALARKLYATTTCAAVMVGRGALGDPWIFARLAGGHDRYPTPSERWRLVHGHLEAHLAFVNEPIRGIKRFRPHLLWYARGLRGATHFRRTVVEIASLAELLEVCEAFFASADFEHPPEADTSGGEAAPIEYDVGAALG